VFEKVIMVPIIDRQSTSMYFSARKEYNWKNKIKIKFRYHMNKL